MKKILLLFISLLSVPALACLSVPITQLSPQELEEMGITLQVKNANDFLPEGIFPLYFTLNAHNPKECVPDDVYVFVNDSAGEIIYGSSVALRNEQYDFQIHKEYLQNSTVGLTCMKAADDGMNDNYRIYVRDFIRAP